MKAPIAIMSFNRPDYLRETLASLKAQSPSSIEGREIHLFQDGAVNQYSRIKYAAQSDIDRSILVFKEYFPSGKVHYWNDNVGICENFYRAESYLFHEREFDFSYFFEDDMILSPVYLDMMELMQEFVERTPKIAYFSAYGDYYAKPEELSDRHREVINLDHHWAFGLRRTAWLRIRDFLEPYYKIIRFKDYARRDHRAVFDLFATKGATPRGSSQDAAKAWACDQLGLWRCRTFAPFARYIGSTGAHMTQEAFETLGYARTVVQTEVIKNLNFPDDVEINTLLDEQHDLFVDVFNKELAEIRRSLPARKFNPTRLCTIDDVEYAYRLLLHRDPDSEDIIKRHVGKTPVFRLIWEMGQSKEFLGLHDKIKNPS